MTNIRRYFEENRACFLTHVTQNRKPILVENIDLIKTSLQKVNANTPFDLKAWVVLPDHIHMLIDPGKYDVSKLMRKFKLLFSGQLRSRLGIQRGGFWQNRFWDHIIRNEKDFNRHIDYIHYNPVKHGLVRRPNDWPHSSFAEFLEAGFYGSDWGAGDDPTVGGEYGE